MNEDHFEQRLKEQVRWRLDELPVPEATAARLHQARQQAIAALEVDRLGWLPRPWVPTLAYAATLMFAVGVWYQTLLPPLPSLDDPREAAAAQEFELLDDLEFVAWMEAEMNDSMPLDQSADGSAAAPTHGAELDA